VPVPHAFRLPIGRVKEERGVSLKAFDEFAHVLEVRARETFLYGHLPQIAERAQRGVRQAEVLEALDEPPAEPPGVIAAAESEKRVDLIERDEEGIGRCAEPLESR